MILSLLYFLYIRISYHILYRLQLQYYYSHSNSSTASATATAQFPPQGMLKVSITRPVEKMNG